jgi:hypothetical protein
MAVTITTADFVGLLSDAIPFAFGDDALGALAGRADSGAVIEVVDRLRATEEAA